MRRVMILAANLAFSVASLGDTWTDPETGIVWTYTVSDGIASVGGGKYQSPAVPRPTTGDITIPAKLGDCPVKSIALNAFCGCSGLTTVTIPSSVTNIGYSAFAGCKGLMTVTIPSSVISIGPDALSGCGSLTAIEVEDSNPNYFSSNGLLLSKDGTSLIASINGDVSIPSTVTSIGDYAFSGRSSLTNVTIPIGVTNIGSCAFESCTSLTSIEIPSNVPSVRESSFACCCSLTNVVIRMGVRRILDFAFEGCSSLASVALPDSIARISWYAFAECNSLRTIVCSAKGETWIRHLLDPDDYRNDGLFYERLSFVHDDVVAKEPISITVTNIVVHYIQTSEQSPMTAPITNGVGLVNVMTEIKGGNVAIPETWVSNYSTFKTKFGNDFSTALTKTTGKKDAAGNPMLVWQDYVAGTDPTDENSVFRASVTMVDGKPVVSYTPELSTEEKAKRKYTTLGKVKLQDAEWVEVSDGHESDYNFFKVTVEMK